jgi:hypothetical protein
MGQKKKQAWFSFGFLLIAGILLSSISIALSIAALVKSTNTDQQQNEVRQLTKELGYAIEQAESSMIEASRSFAVEPQPKSLFDSMTQTYGNHKPGSMSSYALPELKFIVNGSFVLPDSAVRLPGSKSTYFIGEKMLDMYEYNIRKRGAFVKQDEDSPQFQRVQVMAHVHWENAEAEEDFQQTTNAATTCYAFNAVGAFWKKTEDYILTTTNTEGLTDSQVDSAFKRSVAAWLDNIPNHQVVGSRLDQESDGVSTNEPDGKNELVFGPISTPGVIAVTITYGIFSGTIANRQIMEWDMILNQRDYNFGDASVSSSKMDLESIIIHEFGHALGLADEYDSKCSHVTMYG